MFRIKLSDYDAVYKRLNIMLKQEEEAAEVAEESWKNSEKIEDYIDNDDLGVKKITTMSQQQVIALMHRMNNRPYPHAASVNIALKDIHEKVRKMLYSIDYVRRVTFKAEPLETGDTMASFFKALRKDGYGTDPIKVLQGAYALIEEAAPKFQKVYDEVMVMETINEPTDEMFYGKNDNNGMKAIEGGPNDIILDSTVEEEKTKEANVEIKEENSVFNNIMVKAEEFLASMFKGTKKVINTVYTATKKVVKKVKETVSDLFTSVKDFLAGMFKGIATA